jgi:hypothetical protein
MAPTRSADAECAAIMMETASKIVVGRCDIWYGPYLVSIHKWSFCPISASICALACAA